MTLTTTDLRKICDALEHDHERKLFVTQAAFRNAATPTRVRAMLDEMGALKAELKTALKRSAEYAREAGEWKGRYEAAGYPGTLDGWIARAEAAEALVKEAGEVVMPFAHESMRLGPEHDFGSASKAELDAAAAFLAKMEKNDER